MYVCIYIYISYKLILNITKQYKHYNTTGKYSNDYDTYKTQKT